MKRDIVVIAHDLRSCHNVGSLLRTADGIGVKKVWLTGYTPYPKRNSDTRLAHLAVKVDAKISKTALGAQNTVPWEHASSVMTVLEELRETGYVICALEQTPDATMLADYSPPNKIALLLGREVEGIETALLKAAAVHLAIPMQGNKESFNVIQAAAMALYHLRYSR